MKAKDVVLIGATLLVLLLLLALFGSSMPSGFTSGHAGGGFGGGSGGTIIIPPSFWAWLGGLFLDYAITPITDCIRQGTCTQSDGPLGGGGGGGFGGNGPVNYPNNAKPAWNWLACKECQ